MVPEERDNDLRGRFGNASVVPSQRLYL